MKLLNYGAAALVVLPLVVLVFQAINLLDVWTKTPWAWVPTLTVIIVISIGIYDWSSKWIAEHRDRSGVRRQA